MSLTCGMLPAIEVSGMFVFRGGGGGGSKFDGLYAVLVWIFRFDDCCVGCIEENVLVRLWQGLNDRKMRPVDEVMGVKTRCRLIVKAVVISYDGICLSFMRTETTYREG